jgi:predicted phosphate transport protein (TIGR00153 family)
VPFQILPAEHRFYDWFEKAATNMVEAARLLKEAVAAIGSQEQLEHKVRAITEAEHHGDFIVHEIFDLLRSTFITPLERGEIQGIASAIDDVVDRIEAAGDALLVYKIDRARPEATRLAEIVLDCAEQINQAMPNLREKSRLARVRECMIEVNRLENEADAVLRAGMVRLVERPDDVFELIRWKEVFGLLEEATDRAEDVADVLNGIVFENA